MICYNNEKGVGRYRQAYECSAISGCILLIFNNENYTWRANDMPGTKHVNVNVNCISFNYNTVCKIILEFHCYRNHYLYLMFLCFILCIVLQQTIKSDFQ